MNEIKTAKDLLIAIYLKLGAIIHDEDETNPIMKHQRQHFYFELFSGTDFYNITIESLNDHSQNVTDWLYVDRVYDDFDMVFDVQCVIDDYHIRKLIRFNLLDDSWENCWLQPEFVKAIEVTKVEYVTE